MQETEVDLGDNSALDTYKCCEILEPLGVCIL